MDAHCQVDDLPFLPAGAPGLPIHGVTEAVWAAEAGRLPASAARFLAGSGFRAKPGEVALVPGEQGVAGAVFGLPAPGDDPSPYGALAALPEGDWRLGDGFPAAHAAVLGFALGAYRFERLKTVRPERPRPRLVLPPGDCSTVLSAARAAWLGRNLINMPANLLGPGDLADAAAAALRRAGEGVDIAVISGEAVERGYPAVAAVGRAAARPPVVLAAEWHGPGAEAGPHVAICGKGVCFDSGGLDIKPPAGMLRMKKDKAGAATALALACMIIEARLPVRLSLRLGCVENAISGHAMRPLDVIPTRLGRSVEIGNTDAEGRLVLADLLADVSENAPRLILDFATLTGAARVALGPDVPAYFCNDDALASRFAECCTAAHDPAWRLPLWDGYNLSLDSHGADLNNVSAAPHAGAIVAGLFLQRFVGAGCGWIHLDIYGWNETSRPGRPEGGEVQGLRAAFALVTGLSRIASTHEETISRSK